ncbi:MAG: sulfate adenylyltransferase subunit CysN [Planctomycetes bacterium]|nr:sulfate adenylyltransferase subunit CysN [Planctomycetota bacterium]MCB9918432.1 sulfate adenylyltransferase subunit CysN [Planctomycetota bacterium]
MAANEDLATTDIHAYLDQHQKKDVLRFLTAGSVDDGKSTLIGRLLHDCRQVYEDQLDTLQKDSARHGTTGAGKLDFALLTDGLLAEREQGITIDVAYRYFTTPKRKFILADSPGHEQYTRNMATGASTCDLAVILIDARYGVTRQTKRHSLIVSLLGVKHVVVAINKMDLMDWSQDVYDQIRRDYVDFATKLEFVDLHLMPVSALEGDNVVHQSENMPWYHGPSLLQHLEAVHVASDRNFIDMRFPVQYVIRPDLDFRGFAGTVASGVMRKGDDVVVLPSGARSKIASIVTYDGEREAAWPPMAVTVTLEDEIDVSRGDFIVHPGNIADHSHDLDAMVVWMSEKALERDRQYMLRTTTRAIPIMVSEISYTIDLATMRQQEAQTLELNDIARVGIAATKPIYYDTYQRNRSTGCFVLIDRLTNETVAAGMVSGRKAVKRESSMATGRTHKSLVTTEDRADKLGQNPATIWLTGLAKSGKSSIAYALEKRLTDSGRIAKVLDGSELRSNLSRDLGFSAEDRSENVRRAAAVARLFNDTGVLCIAAFVSPFESDREEARDNVGPDRFVEIFCDAPIQVCESRDDEDAYGRARRGELAYFPGITVPYEAPRSPALRLPTSEITVDQAVDRILALLEERGFVRKA